jgi:hypothetical protein
MLTEGESINQVQLRTLDSMVEEFGCPDIIKIDIDGAELFALDTADKIFENRDLIVTIESHNALTDKKITEFYNRNGACVYSINEHRFFSQNDLHCGTTIACKNENKLKLLLAETNSNAAGLSTAPLSKGNMG